MELLTLIVGVIGCLAAVAVIPEVRRIFKLRDSPAESAGTRADRLPAPPTVEAPHLSAELSQTLEQLRGTMEALAQQLGPGVRDQGQERLIMALQELRQPVQMMAERLPRLVVEQDQLRADLDALKQTLRAEAAAPPTRSAPENARLLALVARQADLDLESQFLGEQRLRLGNLVAALDHGPEEMPEALAGRIRAIQAADKMMELNLNRVLSQRAAIEAEIQSVKRVISKNIQDSFRLAGYAEERPDPPRPQNGVSTTPPPRDPGRSSADD